MGAWTFANTFIEEIAEEVGCKSPRPRYAGRPSAASPATGSNARHRQEQAALIDDALTVGKKAMKRIAAKKAEFDAKSTNGTTPAKEPKPRAKPQAKSKTAAE